MGVRRGEMQYYVGLDLGQVQDYSALAVLEWLPKEYSYAVRHLRRFPLGTPYPQICHEVRALVLRPPLVGKVQLVVDATGVGRPVLDIFRKAQLGHGVIGISIHGGDNVSREPAVSGYRVPKRDLVSNLQLLFQARRLKISKDLPEAEVLAQELRSFRVQITESGNDTYGAWRSGEHDDLVLAVSLAAWLGERHHPLAGRFKSERVGSFEDLARRLAEAKAPAEREDVDQFAIGSDSLGRFPVGGPNTTIRFRR